MKKVIFAILSIGFITMMSWALCSLKLDKEHEDYYKKSLKDIDVSEHCDELEKERNFNKKANLGIFIDDIEVPYDKENKCYFIQYGYDLSDIIIKSDYEDIYVDTDVSDRNLKECLKKDKDIRVLACNDDEYTVCNIKITDIPVMNISLMDEPVIEYKYIYAKTVMSSAEYGISEYNSKYQVRGASSLNYDKKSYTLQLMDNELDETNYSLLGMRENSKYALNSMYEDGSKMRDRYSLGLWKQIAASSKSEESSYYADYKYVEVFINNEYFGLYGLTEIMDEDTMGLVNDNKTQDSLFFVSLGIDEWPTLEEIKKAREYKLSCGVMEMKFPKTLKSGYEYDKLYDFVDLIYGMDTGEYESLTEMMDIDNCIDYDILLQTLCAVDNSWKNMFLLWDDDNKNMKMIPWDLDLTLGLMWHNDMTFPKEEFIKYAYFKEKGFDDIQENGVMDRLKRDDKDGTIKKSLQARWKELRKDTLSDSNVNKEITSMYNQINDSHAVERDTERWPKGYHNEDLDEITTFMQKRLEFLDEYYNK